MFGTRSENFERINHLKTFYKANINIRLQKILDYLLIFALKLADNPIWTAQYKQIQQIKEGCQLAKKNLFLQTCFFVKQTE